MKIEELYKVALKAMKETNSGNEKFPCDNCPSRKIQIELNKEHIDYNYNGSTCYNAMLYLQNLGIIKILSGVNEYGSVSCQDLDYEIIKRKSGSKI